MTNAQQKILEQLEANKAAANAVGLVAKVDMEDCGRFVSVSVRISFGAISGPRRHGHDKEFYSHLMIGKRGAIQGTARIGSIFSNLSDYKKGQYFGSHRPDIFDLLTRNGCKFAFDDMIEVARRMEELNRGAA